MVFWGCLFGFCFFRLFFWFEVAKCLSKLFNQVTVVPHRLHLFSHSHQLFHQNIWEVWPGILVLSTKPRPCWVWSTHCISWAPFADSDKPLFVLLPCPRVHKSAVVTVVTLLLIFAYFWLCSSQTMSSSPCLFSAGKVCVPYVSPCSTGRKMSCCDRLQVCCHPPVVILGCLCCVLSEHLPWQTQLFLTFASGDDVLGVVSLEKCSLLTRNAIL